MTEPTPSASTSSASEASPIAPKPAAPKLLISKAAYREVERNSTTIYALASGSKGSQIGRLSLACNELLREICQRKVEKASLDQLEFYLREHRLREEDAAPVIYLAKSIRAIAQSIGDLEAAVPPPACTLKPPLDFGGGDDGMENMRTATSHPSRKRAHNHNALFNDDVDEDDVDVETDGPKPVGSENDLTVRYKARAVFRPLTPEDQIRDDPSPPPSPTIQSMMSKRGRFEEEEEEEDEDIDQEDGNTSEPAITAPPVANKASFCCPMCDTFFYVEHQLNSHLISYHRVKPEFDDVSLDDDDQHQPSGASTYTRPMQSSTARSTAIVTSRPLNGLSSSMRHSNGSATAFVAEQMRTSSTVVTSPGGTMRQYSSASNAARAAAKAAAAAASGVMRPNVPSKPYTCRQCGVLLASQQMYASHVRYNHPKEKLEGTGKEGSTPVVKKSSSSTKETAIVHLQLEDGTKAFQCRRCDKVFDSAQKVAGHSRHCLLVFEGKARPANQGPIPTEDRPYTVYRCGLGSSLARTCPYCGELLPSIRKVDKHVRLVHEASRHEVYGCTTCDRRFVTLGGIENHWLHYGDCPNGVLTVHRDGIVTCADIGEMPPQLKKPRVIVRTPKEDEDPSVEIVNTILGLHGYKVKNGEAPHLTAETNGRYINGEEDEDPAPELEEEEMLNGHSPMDEEDFLDDDFSVAQASKKAVVSLKVIPCRLCNYASRTRDAMDMHMAEEHPDEVLAEGSPEMDDYEEMITTHSSRLNGSASSKSKQTGEMRRMMGVPSK